MRGTESTRPRRRAAGAGGKRAAAERSAHAAGTYVRTYVTICSLDNAGRNKSEMPAGGAVALLDMLMCSHACHAARWPSHLHIVVVQ